MKLNKIEKLKLNLRPYDFYEKLDSLEPSVLKEADRFYLKNFGIYGTKLNPDVFMLRLRITGGRIDLFKLKKILQLTKEYKAKIILTSRSQMELHGLDFYSAVKIHKELEKVGISSWQTLTDNFRNIVTDPLDGISEESVFEVYPIILQMESLFLKNPYFTGMIPRKFNTAVSANVKNISSFFSNDCYFALAQKDNEIGFNLYLGGRNLAVSKNSNIFVKKDDVVSVFRAVIFAYKKYGLRESRSKARLYHLLEKVGMEEFKRMMREFYEKEFEEGGETLAQKVENEKEWFLLKDGSYAYRYKSRFGEIDAKELENITNYALDKGCSLRLGTDQNLYIIGLKNKEFPYLSSFENALTLVCAGSKYCIYSLFDTKEEAGRLILSDIKRLGIKVGYSGCLKGCARHILADIGFVGIRTTVFGKLERGVRLYLGGLYTKGKAEARLIYWAIPLRGLNDILRVIFDEFENSGFDDFEEFSEKILNNYRVEFLAFWFLAKLYTKKRIYLGEGEEKLIKKFEEFDFYDKVDETLYDVIKYLEKKCF